MSKVSRGMKISLIFILNPHRIFLASAVWLSYFVYWLADKFDDFRDGLRILRMRGLSHGRFSERGCLTN